mmetsp:Transcript_4207/g.6174  ORF Transcript_4207/g.6174 Transcript_4207/m.6174 type:complete len:218 (+) Transcript_4207:390-1043(+)
MTANLCTEALGRDTIPCPCAIITLCNPTPHLKVRRSMTSDLQCWALYKGFTDVCRQNPKHYSIVMHKLRLWPQRCRNAIRARDECIGRDVQGWWQRGLVSKYLHCAGETWRGFTHPKKTIVLDSSLAADLLHTSVQDDCILRIDRARAALNHDLPRDGFAVQMHYIRLGRKHFRCEPRSFDIKSNDVFCTLLEHVTWNDEVRCCVLLEKGDCASLET